MSTDKNRGPRVAALGESMRKFDWDRRQQIMPLMIAAAEQRLREIAPSELFTIASHGWPLAAARAALRLSIPVTVLHPCVGYRPGFPRAVNTLYHTTLARADRLLTLRHEPFAAEDQMRSSARWYMAHADLILAAWDGARNSTVFTILREMRARGMRVDNGWLSLPEDFRRRYTAGERTPTVELLDGTKPYRERAPLKPAPEADDLRVITGPGRTRAQALESLSYAVEWHGMSRELFGPARGKTGSTLVVGAVGGTAPDGRWTMLTDLGEIAVSDYLDRLPIEGIRQVFLAVENPGRERVMPRDDFSVYYTIEPTHIPQQGYITWLASGEDEPRFHKHEQHVAEKLRHQEESRRSERIYLAETGRRAGRDIPLGRIFYFWPDPPGCSFGKHVHVAPGPLKRTIIVTGFDPTRLYGREFYVGPEVLLRGVQVVESAGDDDRLLRRARAHGGLRCEVLLGGTMRPDDQVCVIEEECPAVARPPESFYSRPVFIHAARNDGNHLGYDQLCSRLNTLRALRRKHQSAGNPFPYHFDIGHLLHDLSYYFLADGLGTRTLRDAIAEYEAAVAYNPSDHLARVAIASAHLDLAKTRGRYDEKELAGCVEHVEAANRLHPLDTRYWYTLAELHRQRGDGSAAAAALEQSLAVDPLATDGLLKYTNLLLEQRRDEEALACLRRANKSEPGNPKILALLGLSLMRAGRLRRSALAYRASLGIPYYYRLASGALVIEFDVQAVYGPAFQLLDLLGHVPSKYTSRTPGTARAVYETAVYHLRLRDEVWAAPFAALLSQRTVPGADEFAGMLDSAYDHSRSEPEPRVFIDPPLAPAPVMSMLARSSPPPSTAQLFSQLLDDINPTLRL